MNKVCFLDANVLVYIKNEDEKLHLETEEYLKKLIEKNFNLAFSPLVLDEFLYNFYKLIKIKFPEKSLAVLKKALGEILILPKLEIVNPPTDLKNQKKILEFMKKYNLRPRDAYHLITMRFNKIDSFLTFDSDFKKVFDKGLIRDARDVLK